MSTKWTMADIERKGLNVVNSQKKVITQNVVNTSIIEPTAAVPKKSKYNNKKTDGFDSKKEAKYYKELKIKEKGKLVTAIQMQVVFQLSSCKYVADFVFLNLESMQWEVVDVKGMRTQVYILKRKMMFNELKIKIKEV